MFQSGRGALAVGLVLATFGTWLHGQQGYTRDERWPQYPSDMTFEMGTGIAGPSFVRWERTAE